MCLCHDENQKHRIIHEEEQTETRPGGEHVCQMNREKNLKMPEMPKSVQCPIMFGLREIEKTNSLNPMRRMRNFL
jgi:hypothetical protein